MPDNFQSPPAWTAPGLSAYTKEIRVDEPAFGQEVATSTGLSLAATALTSAIAFLGAYGLAGWRSRLRPMLVQGSLILATVPVMAYVFPLGATLRRGGLEDTFVGLVLAQSAALAPLAVYVLYGYLAQLPAELEEAAVLDGASTWQTLRWVVLPLAAPALAATAVVLFVLSWNQYLVPLVLTASRIKTIPVAMSDFFTFERELEWPTAAAALVVSLFPLTVLVALAQRALAYFTLNPGLPGARSRPLPPSR